MIIRNKSYAIRSLVVLTLFSFLLGSCKDMININTEIPAELPPAGETLQSILIENAGNVIVGNNLQLLASGNYSNGQSVDITSSITWSSTDSTIVSVTADGLITAVAPGTATVNANSAGAIGSIDITVVAASLTGISVTAISTSPMMIGLTNQFTAAGSYDNGQSADITGTVIWSCSSNIIATVISTGLVTAATAGSVIITASSAEA